MSPPTDEDQIYRLVAALDLVLDRCEETMQHTGQPILAWLKSQIAAETSPRPFSFLETQQSRSRYRRTWKQFVTFILRAFRLEPLACQELLRLKFPPQIHVLQQIWANSLQAVARDPPSQRLSTKAASSLKATAHTIVDKISLEVYNEEIADELSVSESDEDEKSDSLITILLCIPNPWSPQAPPDRLIEIIFNLCVLLITQEFTDGNPQSSVLVYFTGGPRHMLKRSSFPSAKKVHTLSLRLDLNATATFPRVCSALSRVSLPELPQSTPHKSSSRPVPPIS